MNGESSRYDKLESMLQGGSSEPHNVPLKYLRNVTNNFSVERLLGKGGFGTVYKGVLQNGETIAVKKFNSSIPGAEDRQFDNEANHLMRLKHPNVVLLIGWCSEAENIYVEYNGKYVFAEKSERLLCLEYMPKGNLRGYLSDEFSGLGWDTRYKIIEGICYGLRYLHEECQINAPIVHMDLKPANILLDNNMVPKIADFGLSRLFSEEKTWTCTRSRDGSLGYMSPEYIKRGLVSRKSDIFSLGVIIIEIVTGRRDYPDDTGTPSEEFIEMVLHNWSRRNGVSLEVDYQQIRRCIQIGLNCVKTDRSKRPTISQIIKALHRPENAESSKGVDRPQSGKRDINCGETGWMERPAEKYTPGFSIYETFTVALHQWQKKAALRRIRVIFTTAVFVVLLKQRGTHARSRLPLTAARLSRPPPRRRRPSASRSAAPASAGGGAVVDCPTSIIENHHAAAHHSAELPSPPSDDEGAGGPQALPLKPRHHQPAVAFAEASGSLLQTSDSEDEYEEEDDDAGAGEARSRAAAGQSSSFLSPAHWRGPRARDCYRCGKGGGFWGRDKESCLACGAQYCVGCVLRAMGSMPEGRKCLECIGRPVAESRRDALGRGSHVLRRLLSAAEVELVMRSERVCTANQLRAEDVYVNGTKLSLEELVVLQGCPCPPSRLRAGFYWYDKVSGLWGKEGYKPHCIITPNLNVGGSLDQKASNGNVGIFINGREITTNELQMLKLAGVQCAGKRHFWVNADGTYQEEGQKTVKGKIWDKPIVKLLSPVLSLPTPNKAANQSSKDAVNIVNRVIPDYLEQRTIQKLMLVGSGASTILKQAKFLYKSGKPFSVDEREDLKLIIQSNIYNYLGILLEGRERFEEESLADRRKISPCDPSRSGCCESGVCDEVTEYSLIPRLKAFLDWILKAMALGNLEDIFPAASREYAPLVEELWKDPAIQATYRRRTELPFLPPAANYFLDKAVDISRTEYELSDMDILYADGITSSDGLASTEFSFPQLSLGGLGVDEPDAQDTLLRYQLIRINSRGLHENCKWLQMFDDVRLVIFCVAASDYDEYYEDANGTIVNKMVESRQLFESIVLHPTFEQMDFLLLLTKFDLLEQKINDSPLTSCDWFDNFTPLISRNLLNGGSSKPTHSSNAATLSQMAAHYMATKFKRLFQSLTDRKLYVSYVNALNQESVRSAILFGREIVKWEEEFGASETVYSEDSSEDSLTH